MIDCPKCNGTGKIKSASEVLEDAWTLKKQRTDAKLKLREVAVEMGYSIGHIGDLEQGRRKWGHAKQMAYSNAIANLLRKRAK